MEEIVCIFNIKPLICMELFIEKSHLLIDDSPK